MPLVPNFTTPTAHGDLSPRARDLNQRLDQAIDEFRRYYPDTTDRDVRQALMAVGAARGGGAGPRAATAAILAGLAVAGVIAFFAASRTTPDLPPTFWMGATAAVLAIVVAIKRLVRRS